VTLTWTCEYCGRTVSNPPVSGPGLSRCTCGGNTWRTRSLEPPRNSGEGTAVNGPMPLGEKADAGEEL